MHLATYAVATPKTAIVVNKKALLDPPHKYYGVFVPGAPDNIAAITDPTPGSNTITAETGKQPNLVLYYQAWDSLAQKDVAGKTNFDMKGAENACAQGLLPMMTWESWDTTDISQTQPVGGVAYAQPDFSLYNINHGLFDNVHQGDCRRDQDPCRARSRSDSTRSRTATGIRGA